MSNKILRIDNGGEFISNKFKKYLQEKWHNASTQFAYNRKQNGKVERKNLSLIDSARLMLKEVYLPHKFLEEAVATPSITNNTTQQSYTLPSMDQPQNTRKSSKSIQKSIICLHLERQTKEI